MERTNYDVVVAFTFDDSEKLGEYFVEVIKDEFGKNNVEKIDQSTYGIKVASVNMETLLVLLHKAEGKGEKCNDGSKLCLMTANSSEQQIISQSLILQTSIEQLHNTSLNQ